MIFQRMSGGVIEYGWGVGCIDIYGWWCCYHWMGGVFFASVVCVGGIFCYGGVVVVFPM